MPKQVDHAARRAEIAQAALRLCAREGLAEVSIGRVAQEAGISKGLVQHYFAAKADLLRASAHLLRQEIEQHLRAASREADGPADTLRRTLLGVVELGAQAPLLLLAGHAFFARAAADPEVRGLYRTGGDMLHREVAQLVAAAAPDADASAEAHVLLGVARGLGDSVLVGELSVAEATTILDHQLRRLNRPAGVSGD
ncbi:TetR family transcriptional regulator [Nonomuraea sp. NPDC050310]|uniref:TetR/AcrR family transcriptional regulator n=1 Tax=Nonomuraea sp. NPDC050310 TaxID=3154935 RepID=UPI0033EF1A78